MSLNAARADGENRDARLSRKTFPEEKKILDSVKADAFATCKSEIAEFAECAKANNIFVIFNCKEQNRKMNECVDLHTTQAHIDACRQRRIVERAEKVAADKKAEGERAAAEKKAAKKGGWF